MSSRLRSRLRASTSLSGGGGGPAANLDLDFVAGTYKIDATSYAFQDLIRFSRTTAGTFVGSDGLIQNTPISKNILLWTEEADNASWVKGNAAIQTNFLQRSQEFDASPWGNSITGTGLTPTVTADQGAAPDGTLTADRIQFSLAGGTATGDVSRRRQIYATSGSPHTFSVYLKSFDGVSTYDMHIVGPQGFTTPVVVTPTWQRFTVTANGVGSVSYAIGLRGGQTPANSNTADVLAWGAQLVQGSVAGDYVATGGAIAPVQYAAPNGLVGADKLIEDTASGVAHNVYQLYTASNAVQTFSVYLKEGERRYATATIGNATARYVALFDLQTGVFVTSYTNGTPTSTAYSITSVGSGWYRVSVTMNSASASKFAEISLSDSASPSVNIYGQPLYAGDGSSGIYIWGAQMEEASSATSYTRNADGLYAPRLDYNPVTLAAKGLLIEEARTNLVTYSDQFNNAVWAKFGSTITANATLSPDGTANADALYETATTNEHQVNSLSPTFAANTPYTLSAYVKSIGGRNCTLFWYTNSINTILSATFDLTAGTIVVPATGTGSSPPTNISATITDVGNGWYRVTLTGTTTATAGAGSVRLHAASGTIYNYLGDITKGIYIYGAQLEAGANASAYIPTVASTVTRNADIPTVILPALSGLYNPSAGTLVIDVIPQLSNSGNQFIGSLSDGTANNRASIFKSTAGLGGFRTTSAGVATNPTAPANALTGNVTHKVALALTTGANNVACAVDGTLGTPATLSAMPTGINIIRLGVSEDATTGWLNGHIRRIRYFNTRLTNAELQAVTT